MTLKTYKVVKVTHNFGGLTQVTIEVEVYMKPEISWWMPNHD